jgi:hypothetical protein
MSILLASILLSLFAGVPAIAGTTQYNYDHLDRLTRVESIDGNTLITYTYDSVGNRLSMTAQGVTLDTLEVTDTGFFHLDNTSLDLTVTTYGSQFGNLAYEYTIGTSSGGTDIIDWTYFSVNPDGTATLEGLILPYNQEYFVSVRVRNFTADLVTNLASTDGITVLDSGADPDEDSFDNEAEITAGSNPLNPNSFPGATTITLYPGFNMVAIPAEVAYISDLKDWLPILGWATQIKEVHVLDKAIDTFMVLDLADPECPSFSLQGGEGLIVYALEKKTITFLSLRCSPLTLEPGFNLVGISCPQQGYGAYDLLQEHGADMVTSVQRYNSVTGAFETAGFDENGQIVGIDFPIIAGEGYIVYAR